MEKLREALFTLLLNVFRQDWLIDFHEETYYRTAEKRTMNRKINILTAHSVFVRNVGTGRIRLFTGMYLLPGEYWRDENQVYRKYARDIDLLLADPENDPESYTTDAVPALTYKAYIIIKKVTNS